MESGGKIIMPSSALDHLIKKDIDYSKLFKLTNKRTKRITHCGVLESVEDAKKVYLPYWIRRNLLLKEEDSLKIESVSLPVAAFLRIQPQSADFLYITNPKTVLKNCLRRFSCLTTGDVIAIKYNQSVYELCVKETKPGNAVSIIECDISFEFAPPGGYKEPEHPGYVAFCGESYRVDGKKTKARTSAIVAYERGIPDLDYEIGTLRFIRNSRPPSVEKKEPVKFEAFTGKGYILREKTP